MNRQLITYKSILTVQTNPATSIFINQKGERVAILYEKLCKTQNILTRINITHPLLLRSYAHETKLIPPSNIALQRSRKQLKEINNLNEELRKFIKLNFSVDEII